MENQDKIYFVSKGSGQFFKREGGLVLIVSTYEFNPSIERTTYSDKLLSDLGCRPSTQKEFEGAVEKTLGMIGVGLPVAA